MGNRYGCRLKMMQEMRELEFRIRDGRGVLWMQVRMVRRYAVLGAFACGIFIGCGYQVFHFALFANGISHTYGD